MILYFICKFPFSFFSNISCDFKSFNEVGINESYIYARYGTSKYQIAIWVGDSKYFEEEDSTNKPYKFEISFPFVLSKFLRLLSLLPYKWSFSICKKFLK